MASRRKLKKEINIITGDLFAECIIINAMHPNQTAVNADEVMASILYVQDEFIKRISHTEAGSVKLFYKKLCSDFSAKVDDICESLSKMNGE